MKRVKVKRKSREKYKRADLRKTFSISGFVEDSIQGIGRRFRRKERLDVNGTVLSRYNP